MTRRGLLGTGDDKLEGIRAHGGIALVLQNFQTVDHRPHGADQIVTDAGDEKRREIQIGQFNDDFIEVKNGLKEGERVLLRAPGAPETVEPASPTKDQKPPETEKKSAPMPASVPATASKA